MTIKTPPPPTKIEVTAEDAQRIAAAIRSASAAGKALKAAGLNNRALILLLQDATNCRKDDIARILNALPLLQSMYLTK